MEINDHFFIAAGSLSQTGLKPVVPENLGVLCSYFLDVNNSLNNLRCRTNNSRFKRVYADRLMLQKKRVLAYFVVFLFYL